MDSRTGKFRPESRLPILQISFIYRKTAELNRYQTDGFQEVEHEFPIGTFRSKKLDFLYRCSVVSGKFFRKFSAERPKTELCTIYFPTGFSRIFLEMVNDHYPK